MRLDTFDKTLVQVQSWSCDDQLDFARRVAANIGYELRPENTGLTIEQRVERLEVAMRETNPGLDI